jgi:UDP-glucuronate decarboxylase
MMRILVTGGAGFLGSHLCERLLHEGHEVLALDDLSTGSRANVAHLLRSRRFSLVEHDITNPYDFAVQRIYNLASPASPTERRRDPVGTTLTNVLGARNALELGRRHRARVLQASTSEVYGDAEVHPQPESYRGSVDPTGLRACESEGKRCAESLVMDYKRRRFVDVRLPRIFNTYGPRMDPDDGRVVSTFLAQTLRGEDLTVYGDGSQTRSFCYVDDLVDGLIRLMEHAEDPGPVNLGSPIETTVLELAEEVRRVTKSANPIVFHPLPVGDPRRRLPDLERARATLGFDPRTPLHRGLRRTLESFTARSVGPQHARGSRLETA